MVNVLTYHGSCILLLCMLFPFSPPNVKSSFECEKWFTKSQKFHKVKKENQNHEENQYHRQSFLKWKELEWALKSLSIYENLDKQFCDKKNCWREILKRLLDIIKLLASPNLAFRCHDETPNSNKSGKCLAVLHFFAKYDPIIDSHLSSLLSNPKIGVIPLTRRPERIHFTYDQART